MFILLKNYKKYLKYLKLFQVLGTWNTLQNSVFQVLGTWSTLRNSGIPSQVFTFVPLYNATLLVPFTTFIFPKFLFYHFPFSYIIYSTFSIVLIVFPVFLFQCPLFRLPHVISSHQFPVVFPIRPSSHFPNSWPVISLVFFLPDVTFPVFLSSWLFLYFPFPIFLRVRIIFSQFGATYFTHVMYTNCQIPNFLLVCFFFAFPFSISILPCHCLWIIPLYNATVLFPFTTFTFPKLLFYHFPFPYIIYSTFSIVLIVFPVFLFQCPPFQLSPRYFFPSVSSCLPCPSIITFS